MATKLDEFEPFPKIARLSRDCWITEKIDGTNACVYFNEAGEMLVGSRTRWITPEADNAGFARWAVAHREELAVLGPGRHFGEWWGSGIQRKYGLIGDDKRYSLFNQSLKIVPACCSLTPVLFHGLFTTDAVEAALDDLRKNGSKAAPGFMQPEGVVVFHEAGRWMMKKTIENDDKSKYEK